MKKQIADLQKKSVEELAKSVEATRLEIAKLILEKKVSPQKDINALSKKKKMLAQILTVMQAQKKVSAK